MVDAADVARWHHRLKQPFSDVMTRVQVAMRASGRAMSEVQVLAVSKHHSAAAVCAVYDLGQRDFGENYVGELLAKKAAVAATGRRPRWHFTGRLQTNKLSEIAQHCDVLHSLCRKREAQILVQALSACERTIGVYLQVSADNSKNRGGATFDEIEALCAFANSLELQVIGLMGMPPQKECPRAFFKNLSSCAHALRERGLLLHPGLSMGMSGDLEIAIDSGATIVRIGTALFGAREPQPL